MSFQSKIKFILLLVVCLFPQLSVHALTLTDDVWVGSCAPGWTQADCIFDQRAVCDGTIDIDKASYNVGESMVFTADVTSMRNYISTDPRWCKISYKTVEVDPNTAEFNTDTQGVYTSPSGWLLPYRYGPEMNWLLNTLAGTVAATAAGTSEELYQSGSKTITVPALPAGNNYIRAGLFHESGLYVNGSPSVSSGWGFINFTVAPSGPSFTINSSVNNASYGSINPSGAVSVASGGSQAFTTSINATRRLAWYHIDGNTFVPPTNNPYTFNNVLSNRSIQAVLWPYQNLGGISTPTGVTATPQACGGIVVNWNAVAAATAGYMVFEGVPTDPIMMGASGPYMGTSYTRVAGLVPGNRYCFSVEASNTNDSVPSLPVCATAPVACAAPSVDLNFVP